MIFKPAEFFGRELPTSGFGKEFGASVALAPAFASATINGSGFVDTVHQAVITGFRGVPPSDLSIVWLNGSTPIEGATSEFYTPPFTMAELSFMAFFSDEGSGADEIQSSPIAIVEEPPAAPEITSVGTIASATGLGKIGHSQFVSGLVVEGEGVTVTQQPELDGTPVGTPVNSYIPVVADDGKDLTFAIVASNITDSDTDETPAQAITFVAPEVLGTGLWGEEEDTGTKTYDATILFNSPFNPDFEGCTWSVVSGVASAAFGDPTDGTTLSITTANPLTGTITIQCENSGGSAQTTIELTITVPPVIAPTIGTFGPFNLSVTGSTSTQNLANATSGTNPKVYGIEPTIIDLAIVEVSPGVYGFDMEWMGGPTEAALLTDPTYVVDWKMGGVTTGEDGETYDSNDLPASGNLTVTVTFSDEFGTALETSASVAIVGDNSFYSDFFSVSGDEPVLIISPRTGTYAYCPPGSTTLQPITDLADFFENTPVATTLGGLNGFRQNAGDDLTILLSKFNWPHNAAASAYIMFQATGAGQPDNIFSANNGTTQNRIKVFMATGPLPRLAIRTGNADQANVNLAASITNDVPHRIAVAWAANSANGSYDGGAVGTLDTSVTLHTGANALDRISFGHELGADDLGGALFDFVLYAVRIPDADLPEQASAPDPYAAYLGPSGQIPSISLDFDNAVYAYMPFGGGALQPVPDVTTFVNGWPGTGTSTGSDGMLVGDGLVPTIPTNTFDFSTTGGTIVFEIDCTAASGDRAVEIGDGTQNNRIICYRSSGGQWRVEGRVAGVTGAGFNVMAHVDGAVERVAFSWAAGDYAGSGNGAAVQSAAGGVPTGLTKIGIGVDNGTTRQPEGVMILFQYFKDVFSDVDLVNAAGA